MTNKELLEQGIYCPDKIDLSIIIYLKLGFKVLLAYYNRFSIISLEYIILEYTPEFYSNLDFNQFIKYTCNIEDITDIRSLESYAIINDNYVFTIYVGSNQIEDLKLYLINYGDKD